MQLYSSYFSPIDLPFFLIKNGFS